MNIIWEKTVIGGDTAPGDFVAKVEGNSVGRITKIAGGPQGAKWQWNFQLGHGDFRRGEMNGIEAEKQQAADKIKAEFARYLEYPSEKGGGVGLKPAQWHPRENAYAKAKGG